MTPEVVAVNLASRFALTSDDVILRFDKMFDCDGDETDRPEEAVAVIAQHPDGQWWTIDLRAFENAGTH